MANYCTQILCLYGLASLAACAATSPSPASPNATGGADAGAQINLPEPDIGLSDRRVSVGADIRDYVLYVPETYSHNVETPVMLNFHGGSGDANGHLFIADMRSLADAENFILVYPEGSPLESGESHWNPLPPGAEGKSDANDFGFVEAILDDLEANYRIDSRRVYATGYSNGAGMSYGLACYLSDRIAAIAPVSGSMYNQMQSNCEANHPTAVAIFNGTEDFARPYEGYPGWFLPVDDAAAFWANYNNTDQTPQRQEFRSNGLTIERSVYIGGTNGTQVAKYKVVGGQHVWFDLSIEGSDLNRLIWDFVSMHDLSGAR